MRQPVLYHGSGVDLFEDRFFEGAWDGNFADVAFDRSANVFGSGARVHASAVTFVPPSHTFEPLVQFAGNGLTAVSNSLPFLSAFCSFELDPIDWRSAERFATITQGLDYAVQSFPLKRGILTVRFHNNFVVMDGVTCESTAKPLPPRFGSFDSYYNYVFRTSRDICANAEHQARIRQYKPLATLSSGYDSAAAAVIAAALGCREAVSVTRSQRGLWDSGAEVANVLGLELREFERINKIPEADLSLAEFLAAGAGGEDHVYHVLQDRLPGRVVFTGFLGDRIWGDIWGGGKPPSEKLLRKDLAGSSLGEFRLARDFVYLNLPSIGCLRHPDIYRISRSAEMAAYSVGGYYDRPIPRRILETAGVPRTAFGQRKIATSIHFYRRPESISKKAHAAIESFEGRLNLSWGDRLHRLLRSLRWKAGMPLFHWFQTLAQLRGSRIPPLKALRPIGRAGIYVLSRIFGPYEIFEHGDPRNVVWHLWAVSCVKTRYFAVRRKFGADINNRCGGATAGVQSLDLPT
jgi:hypothetical protein